MFAYEKGQELKGWQKIAATLAAGGLAVGAYLVGAHSSEEGKRSAYVSCGTEDVAVIADPETGRGEYVCLDWLGQQTKNKPTVYGGTADSGLYTSNK